MRRSLLLHLHQRPLAPRTGTIIIGLYGKAVPETAANFEKLVSGDTDGDYSYKGTTFYKIVQGLNMQAGAIGDFGGKGATGVSATASPPYDS